MPKNRQYTGAEQGPLFSVVTRNLYFVV